MAAADGALGGIRPSAFEPGGERRTALQYLDDILEAIGNIEEDTTGITYDEFVADRRRRDAVIRNFQVIGEAIKNLPDDLKEGYPKTDWKKIAGFRDVLTHANLGTEQFSGITP